MKISIDRNVVEIKPESEQETASLNVLWKIIIDCYGDNKKLAPMGQFVPGIDNVARFNIEGVRGGTTVYNEEKTAPEDNTYYCHTCNKYMNVKTGTAIPLCCGKEMEVID
ncbi:hypothetical protein [Desulforhopalus singaporensis]|uniref:Desulfoferrodoxin N-terminal domain-containing protein n=1 Tax=Desulforhopalus singaporensis TaxID=91360 RepID=A0A1H0RUZ4_9BACT|nr:hypothetical protein [Desulforhopalus singaporensis]SDP33294.1 hypothetical protein SAMN05660330_02437 [Desulforhopalus singaporensis]